MILVLATKKFLFLVVEPSELGSRGSGRLLGLTDGVVLGIRFGLNVVVGGAGVRCWLILHLLLRGLEHNRNIVGGAGVRCWLMLHLLLQGLVHNRRF